MGVDVINSLVMMDFLYAIPNFLYAKAAYIYVKYT